MCLSKYRVQSTGYSVDRCQFLKVSANDVIFFGRSVTKPYLDEYLWVTRIQYSKLVLDDFLWEMINLFTSIFEMKCKPIT